MMFRVYLAGKMSNRYVVDVKSERAMATNIFAKYKIHSVDPAASESRLWGTSKHAKISTKFRRKVMDAMVQQDLWLIRRCDLLLVLTGDICSEGTQTEMLYAKSIGIPVVMIAPERYKENLMGWNNITIPKDHIFSDIESAARFINKRYHRAYEKNHKYFNVAIRNAVNVVNKNVKNQKKRNAEIKRKRRQTFTRN